MVILKCGEGRQEPHRECRVPRRTVRQPDRQAEDRLTAEVTVGQITIIQISSSSFTATLLPFSGAPTEKERTIIIILGPLQ